MFVAVSSWLYNHRPWLFDALVGTVVGAFLAIAGGIYQFNRNTRITEDRKRQQLLALLAAELNETLHTLAPSSLMTPMTIILRGGDRFEVVTTYVQPLIVEEAARSGLIGTQETPQSYAFNTFAFVRLARRVREYNQQVLALYLTFGSPDEMHLREAIHNVNVAREDVVRDCRDILTWLRDRGVPTDAPPELGR